MSFLFGGGQSSTPSPAQSISPVSRMPRSNDAVSRNAARVERQRVLGRSGRSSTILSRRGEPGTNSYSNSLLGQAG